MSDDAALMEDFLESVVYLDTVPDWHGLPVHDYDPEEKSSAPFFADLLRSALANSDEWLSEKAGTSEGARKGWEKRHHGGQAVAADKPAIEKVASLDIGTGEDAHVYKVNDASFLLGKNSPLKRSSRLLYNYSNGDMFYADGEDMGHDGMLDALGNPDDVDHFVRMITDNEGMRLFAYEQEAGVLGGGDVAIERVYSAFDKLNRMGLPADTPTAIIRQDMLNSIKGTLKSGTSEGARKGWENRQHGGPTTDVKPASNAGPELEQIARKGVPVYRVNTSIRQMLDDHGQLPKGTRLLQDYKTGTLILSPTHHVIHQDVLTSSGLPDQSIDHYVRLWVDSSSGVLTASNLEAGTIDDDTAVNRIYKVFDKLHRMGLPEDTPTIIRMHGRGEDVSGTLKSAVAWEEDKHPRGKGGEFAPKGSSQSFNHPPAALYHGTSDMLIDKVLKEGLKPASPEGRIFWSEYYKGDRSNAVFLAEDAEQAAVWGNGAIDKLMMKKMDAGEITPDEYYHGTQSGNVVVFEVELPDNQLEDDDLSPFASKMHVGTIPPENIVAYQRYSNVGDIQSYADDDPDRIPKPIGDRVVLKKSRTFRFFVPVVVLPTEKKSAAFDEQKHPRKDTGKFAPKGEGESSSAQASAEQPSGEPDDDIESKAAKIEQRVKELYQSGQDTLSLYDEVNGVMGMYTPARQRQHEQIIDDIMRAHEHVKAEKLAVISGGLTGAGKTTTLTSEVGKNTAGINPDEFITINPDDMKSELIKRKMLPEYEGVNPGEAAALMHEESSKLAWDLHYRAVGQGKNVIWDMTMSSVGGVEQRLNKLNEAGYSTRLVYVHTTVETSIKRSDARYQQGLKRDPKTARYVPHTVITAQADPEYGTKNRKAFEAVKDRATDGWFLFDNNGSEPKLVKRSE